ncbi:hypothetical protein SBV1_2690003 [Verrucomicrobia bacterium]|nr:hypothetical protein SBV1_2690003 [Verrucomicrobiota bacterium]
MAATGTPPLSYQWLKNGLALNDSGTASGTQTATLTLSNVGVGDAGGYSVIVSNTYGSVTSIVAMLTVADPFAWTIAGTNYMRTGTPESVSVSFLIPDGGVTSGAYSGFVELEVAGVGECLWSDLNDAFYVYTDTQHNPVTPVNYCSFWQLAVDSAPLVGPTDTILDAQNYIFYDLNAHTEVRPAYVPAYASNHVYDFVINANLLPSGGLPCALHFGICDEVFSDNSGGFSIVVQQLGSKVPPSILANPCPQTAEAGATVHFAVDAIGLPSPAYEWYFNGTNTLSCASSNLVLANVLFSQSGTYTVVVSNLFGTVTSAPVTLNVIAPVARRLVPGIDLIAQPGGLLGLDYRDNLGPTANWAPMATMTLSNSSQFYFDLSTPLPPQRFYRAWQSGTPGVVPSLSVAGLVPAITLTGNVGDSLRLDYINQFGPTDAWATLTTVTLTNTSQLYFDTSSLGQPARLWRIVPVP